MDDLKGWAPRGGGVRLRGHKSASTRAPLEPAPLPSELVLPLEGGLSARDIQPVIKTGQRVLRGQPLMRGGGPLTTWAHASTSGVVRSLETRPVGHALRREALCAVLEVDGEDSRAVVHPGRSRSSRANPPDRGKATSQRCLLRLREPIRQVRRHLCRGRQSALRTQAPQ